MPAKITGNIMTWATILLAAAAVAGSAAELFPQAAGLGLAKASIIAGAAGRALVFAVREWASVYAIASGEGEADDAE